MNQMLLDVSAEALRRKLEKESHNHRQNETAGLSVKSNDTLLHRSFFKWLLQKLTGHKVAAPQVTARKLTNKPV